MILVGEDDDFTREVAAVANAKLVPVELHSFADGEVRPRIEGVQFLKGEDVALILRKDLNENANSYLLNFLLLGDVIRKSGCKRLTGVMPYLVYARQDKVFRDGEPGSLDYLASVLEKTFDYIITISSHFQREDGLIKRFPFRAFNVDGFKALKEKLPAKDLFFLAPDKGEVPRARELARELRGEFDYLEKTRDRATGKTKIEEKPLKVEGKNVVITDDMVSTGGTIALAVEHVKRFNPKSVTVAFVHGAFTPGAVEKLKALNVQLLYTDTIRENNASVTIALEIAKVLKT